MELLGTTSCGSSKFEWGKRTYVMGVVNVSPDSFSGDGLSILDDVVSQAKRFVTEGADIIDVGGESTRPGSKAISIDEELNRVVPVIERLCQEVPIPISIDTYKSEVAERAVAAGARMLNDIWGLKHDPSLAEIAAREGLPIVLMSNQRNETVNDIIETVYSDLQRAVDQSVAIGVARENIIIDPGLGFGKTLEQNLEIVRRLADFKSLGKPLLLGPSRKSMIGMVLDLPADQRVEGTAAAIAIGIVNGSDIVRVHDVRQMKLVCRMSDSIVRPNQYQ